MLRTVITAIFALVFLFGFGQKIASPLEKFDWLKDDSEAYFGDSRIPIGYFQDAFIKNKQVVFDNCVFYRSIEGGIEERDIRGLIGREQKQMEDFEMRDCVYPAVIDFARLNVDDGISLERNKLLGVYMYKTNAYLSINNNKFKDFLSKAGVHNSVYFSNNTPDSAEMKIVFSMSRIDEFSLEDDSSKIITLRFSADTLNGTIDINSEFSARRIKKDSAYLVCFVSHKTYVNAAILARHLGKRSKLVFTDCVFGPNADLKDLAFDTVVFDRCIITSPLYLSFDSPNRSAYLSIVSTSTTNLFFNFSDNLHLFFPVETHPDYISSTWENLLSKFQEEGKNDSHRNVDIAYQQYSDRPFVNFLNKYWWNYGYSKGFILYWTVAFLLLFHCVNFIFWRRMQRSYSMIPFGEDIRQHEEAMWKYVIRKQLNVFIYTCYIFFSLRIDFEKLRYKSSRFLAIFFVQYIVGLSCLFFIANAILKLG